MVYNPNYVLALHDAQSIIVFPWQCSHHWMTGHQLAVPGS